MRILELPLALCPGGKLSIAALLAREDPLQVGFSVFIGTNYALTGDPVLSFDPLSSHNRFAQSGQLLAEYPAATNTIDLERGLVVTLTGADTTLDEQTAANGLADDLLVFLNGEILSVLHTQLIALNTYHLHVIRERFATPRQVHASGSDVWIIRREDLLPLQHPQFAYGNTVSLKIAPYRGRFRPDLADVDEVEYEIAGRVFAEPPLANLSVNGNGFSPSYTTGQDLVIGWSNTTPDADSPSAYTITTRLDFLLDTMVTAGELESPDDLDLVGTRTVTGDTVTIPNADLVTMLGSEVDFFLFARRQVEGPDFTLQSVPQTLLVLKI